MEYVEERIGEDDVIPLVVATHPHADHLAGVPWLLRRNRVSLLIDNGIAGDGAVWNDYLDARERTGRIGRYAAISERPAPLALCGGEVTATAFAPDGLTQEVCARDHNRCSVLLRIDYGATSFLLTGDAERREEKQLLGDERTRALLDVDVLKIGHHGSATSTTKGFLAAVTPICAVISSGDWKRSTRNSGDHGYRLPRAVTIEAIDGALPAGQPRRRERVRVYDGQAKKWILRKVREGLAITARDGDVVVRSDGEHVTCR